MNREDIDDHVGEALSCPVLSRRLKNVVSEIEETVGNEKTREMLYELVDIVLQMGQRVRALETKVTGGSGLDELSRKSVHAPVRDINYRVDFPGSSDRATHGRK